MMKSKQNLTRRNDCFNKKDLKIESKSKYMTYNPDAVLMSWIICHSNFSVKNIKMRVQKGG